MLLGVMNAPSFIFLFFLPALIVLGHDAYLYFFETPDKFELSALGYLWIQYGGGTHTSVAEAMDPDQWRWVEILLKQKAVYIFAAFGVLLTLIYAAIQLVMWAFFSFERLSFEMRKK